MTREFITVRVNYPNPNNKGLNVFIFDMLRRRRIVFNCETLSNYGHWAHLLWHIVDTDRFSANLIPLPARCLLAYSSFPQHAGCGGRQSHLHIAQSIVIIWITL
jgi:hypothetical protein